MPASVGRVKRRQLHLIAQVRHDLLVSRFFGLLMCLSPSLAWCWGFTGHRMLAKHMQDPLPANSCLRQWYLAHQAFVWQDHACDPDRWRLGDSAAGPFDPNEAPRHFLEVDWAQPVSSYPRDYAAAQVQFGKYVTRNGQVPWRVAEMYEVLVSAFRSGDQNAILSNSFWLSHYVTDSFSLLHDTQNFDPNNGVHSRWESDMMGVSANLNELQDQASSLYGTPGVADPKNNIFDCVIVGNGLLPQLIAADQAASGDGGVYNKDTYQLPVLFSLSKNLTARRWADAETVLASLLWSAWAQAGSPELLGADGGFSDSCSRAAPTGEIVLRGYPVPGGFTHPGDGGVAFPPRDAGTPVEVVDAGVNGTDAGMTGGGAGGGTGGGGAEQPPVGCGCSQLEGSMLLLGAVAMMLRRRRV